MSKGLTPQEVCELIEYIQKNNSWENMYYNHDRHRKVVKYYNMTVDTRTGDVWMIEFRQIMNNGKNSDPVVFRTEQDYDLKTRIYEYLDKVEEE